MDNRAKWKNVIMGLSAMLLPHLDTLAPYAKCEMHLSIESGILDLNIYVDQESVPNIPEQVNNNVISIPVVAAPGGVLPAPGPGDLHVKNIGPNADEILIMNQPGGTLYFPRLEERSFIPTPAMPGDTPVFPIDISRAEADMAAALAKPKRRRVFVHLNTRKGRWGTFDGADRQEAFQQAMDKNIDEIDDVLAGDLEPEDAAALKLKGPEAVVRWWWLGPNLEQMGYGQDIEVEE